ncbi:NAD(P)/FAD-dependent oxidoreductase [Massilia sp. TWP1-3-3]|uniref:NAD(P)/FAD-dependent oxidoreductase n=1 Tax=Massilia sp. TWP1-3-3 TaxID=2804573 RepID=UPI003CF814B6
MQTIVIVGGGAGGLELATRLGDSMGKAGTARIVLVDRWPAHFWKPLLHTVASGKRDAQAAQIDYAAQACEHGFDFHRGEVLGVDRAARRIALAPWLTDDGVEVLPARSLGYDKLVLALGSVTNFFGVPGACEHVLTLDDVPQAEAFHQRFIDGCIQASARNAAGAGLDASLDASLDTGIYPGLDAGLDIVIVGGGATGVELAAELSHSARTLARYKVHALDPVRNVRIRILERGPLLLPHLHPRLSKRAARHLRSLGITVCVDTTVERVEAHAVVDNEARVFPSSITLWAAGVEAPAMCATLGLSVNRLRQIAVGPSLQSMDDAAIYAIGDCASFVCPVKGTVPPRAQAAHQQAMFLAQTLAQTLAHGASTAAFAYRDYGSLVSLGPLAAVGVLAGTVGGRKFQVGGLLARWLYSLMYRKHLMALHGFARMAARTVADWIGEKISPSVRLH